jgi:hypothetical protein
MGFHRLAVTLGPLLFYDLPRDHFGRCPSDGGNFAFGTNQSLLSLFDDLNGTTESVFSTSSTNGLSNPPVTGDLNVELEAATPPIDERELTP